MAARRRRRTTSHPARLALLLGLNLVAGYILWAMLFSGGGESGVQARATAAEEAEAAQPEVASAPSILAGPRGEALERDLRSIVSRWVRRAGELSRGKLTSSNVTVAVHVRELGHGNGGSVGFREDRALRPASNLKLITSAAALVLLGPTWSFDTVFEAGGPIVSGTLRGDLVCRAAGDPLFDPEALGGVEDLLHPMVAALRAEGVRVIEGDLVLDERRFPDPAPAPEWPDSSQHWAEYCALSGGFTANRGALTATVEARAPGQAARVTVRPRGHGLAEKLSVRTEAKGRLNVQMHARSSGVLVKGTIPKSVTQWSESMAHPDPVELFGSVVARALAQGGIELQGGVRRERGAPGGDVIAHLRSPLVGTLSPINTDSTNGVADQVFLATGQAALGDGTRAGAARATAEALRRLGVSSEGLVQVDGSGLSRANRVTARQVTALLEAVLSGEQDCARLYLDSLARAGESGTLDDRMTESPARGRVWAKTGFIGGTSALSGVAFPEHDRAFVFSILVEYPASGGMNTSVFKPMQDEICERLVEASL